MDPALDISSPFRNEAKASEGNYDQAIEQITRDDAPLAYWDMGLMDEAPAAAFVPASARHEKRTACTTCDEYSTAAHVPKGGLYRCSACLAGQTRDDRPRVVPVGTFKCCPTAQAEGEGGVTRCAGCSGWYHLRCVGLPTEAGSPLHQYVVLSTTKWYCPEPGCCEKVLMKQLKKK